MNFEERGITKEAVEDGVEKTARLCHEVNRRYCQGLGDNSQLPWDEMPLEHRAGLCAGVEAQLAADCMLTGEQMHERWMTSKLDNGWTLGEKKDTEKKTHPNLKPYAELSGQERFKDALFSTIVRTIWVDIAGFGPSPVLTADDLPIPE